MWKFDIKRRDCEKEVGEAGRSQGKGNRTFTTETNTQRICLKDLWRLDSTGWVFFFRGQSSFGRAAAGKGVRTPVVADDNMLGSTGRKLKDQIEKLSPSQYQHVQHTHRELLELQWSRFSITICLAFA